MSRLNDLCDSLDFAAAHTMEGHAKMAPGVLKLIGELVREAKRIDTESLYARRVAALEKVDREDEGRPTLSQVTVEQYLCLCGKPVHEHFCPAWGGGKTVFRAGPSQELVAEPAEPAAHVSDKMQLALRVEQLEKDMVNTTQAFVEVYEAIEALPTNEELEDLRGEVKEVDRRVDDLEPR